MEYTTYGSDVLTNSGLFLPSRLGACISGINRRSHERRSLLSTISAIPLLDSATVVNITDRRQDSRVFLRRLSCICDLFIRYTRTCIANPIIVYQIVHSSFNKALIFDQHQRTLILILTLILTEPEFVNLFNRLHRVRYSCSDIRVPYDRRLFD